MRPCWYGATSAGTSILTRFGGVLLFIVVGDCAMTPERAPSAGVSGHHERVRAAATAAGQRPRQGRRNPVVTPPARGTASSARQPAGPVPTSRPGVAGRAAAPAAAPAPAAPAAAGTTRHGPQVAP